MHPVMDITAKEAPVFSDFGRRQFTDSGKLVDGGLRYPEELGHFHHGENFPIPCSGLLGLDHRCCRYFIIHDD